MKPHLTFRYLGALLAMVSVAAAADRQSGRYTVVLQAPPVAHAITSRADLASPAAAARRQSVAMQQERVRAALGERGVTVLGSVKVVANALFVRASAEQAKALSTLPGVAWVVPARPLQRTLNKALDLVNASGAWSALGGSSNAGAGVKIAILDSGIDTSHPAMQDSSLQTPAGYPKCNTQSDCTQYTNSKVIVARSYVDLLVDPQEPVYSRPDDLSARDRDGHGTALAMIAAGRTAAGPAGTITGIAPKAWLGNYKIYGSPGLNDLSWSDFVLQAMEDALNDGMDVAVLAFSYTAVWGPLDSGAMCSITAGDSCDPLTGAVRNMVQAGLAVVTAAGNDALVTSVVPALGTIRSAGTEPAAVTVGATTNAHTMVQTLKLNGLGVPLSLTAVNALFTDGPAVDTPMTAPLRDAATVGNDGKLCSAPAANSLAGTIALILRGDCALDEKVINAANAGAVGAVIYNFAGADFPHRVRGLTGTGIPSVLIGNSDGQALKSFLAANHDRAVTLDPAWVALDSNNYNDVALFSSEGPALGTSAIKPELVAPGADIYTAAQSYDPNGSVYNKTGFAAVDGTSASASLVAGAMAMVKQKNRGLTPAQLKSAVVNTASAQNLLDYDSSGPFNARVTGVGAGKLDAGAAVQSTIAVEPATLSFGVVSSTLPSIALKVTNFGSSSANLTFAVQARDADSRAQVVVSPSSATVGAGQSATVTVKLQGSKPNAGSYEGLVSISGGAVPVRVPYLYLVGDGVPYSIFPIEGFDFVGNAGEAVPGGGWITFRLLDRYGVPVTNQPVAFNVTAGGGSILNGNSATDSLGIAQASAQLGSTPGYQEFSATAGGLTVYFGGRGRTPPRIRTPNGIVNAASLRAENGIAPGEYMTIFGSGLADSLRVFATPYLPLALATVSVSFDVVGQVLSIPGHIHFVSAGQVNVQVPWELAGKSQVQVKVSLGNFSTPLTTVNVTPYSPAFFEYTEASSGTAMIAAQDVNYGLIGTANPARRGQGVVLYANGLGPVTNTPASGEVASAANISYCQSPPQVTIGGRTAQVGFCGLTPGIVSLYQLNLTVPADAPTGLQQVIMTQQGATAKTANLMVQ